MLWHCIPPPIHIQNSRIVDRDESLQYWGVSLTTRRNLSFGGKKTRRATFDIELYLSFAMGREIAMTLTAQNVENDDFNDSERPIGIIFPVEAHFPPLAVLKFPLSFSSR